MKKTTISDVARVADVSKSTVSRVLNNVPNVDPELRERVLDVIEKLDYQPSRAARMLKKNLQDVVAFIVPSLADTIFGAVLQGAQDFAYENKMGILAYSTADDLDRQQMYLDGLLSEQLAGLIVVPAPGTDPGVLENMQEQGIPVVQLDRKLQGYDSDYIGTDSFQGVQAAVTHLVKNGYTKIATIAGAQSVSTGVERLTAFRMAITEANLQLHPAWVQFGNFDEKESYRALKTLVELDEPPEAVFIANDLMTIGALQAIRDLGIRVPEDLAIVAFDELPLSDLLTPSLTTVRQATEALGQEALRLLFDRIQRPDKLSQSVQIPAQLMKRDSSRTKDPS